MSEDQSGKSKQSNPGRIALFGAGATTLAVVNMMTNGAEAPSQGVMILQYAALAGGLFAMIGGLLMMAMAPND
jgi:succinate-acetate transporter protein